MPIPNLSHQGKDAKIVTTRQQVPMWLVSFSNTDLFNMLKAF